MSNLIDCQLNNKDKHNLIQLSQILNKAHIKEIMSFSKKMDISFLSKTSNKVFLMKLTKIRKINEKKGSKLLKKSIQIRIKNPNLTRNNIKKAKSSGIQRKMISSLIKGLASQKNLRSYLYVKTTNVHRKNHKNKRMSRLEKTLNLK